MSHVEKQTKENERKDSIVQVLCVKCKGFTRHLIMQSVEKNGTEYPNEHDRSFSVGWCDSYQIVECQGCESTTFRHEQWFSENDGSDVWIYPQRSSSTIDANDFVNVPNSVRTIYRETIDAYNFGSHTLCAAGLRALVEGICADRNVTDGEVTYKNDDGSATTRRRNNLQGKISGLHERGILTEANAEILNEHRFLGNDAVHELSRPPSNELLLAIQILEHTLETLYEIPQTAVELRDRRERRNAT